jgi:2-oxoglutarate ferredoxin oxidoreductase subunit beta
MGTLVPAFNPLAAGLAMGGSFIARGFAGDLKHLTRLMGDALQHRGFGFIDILQPCVSFNHVNTFAWYRQRVYDLAFEGHNPLDPDAARARALEWPAESGDARIPTGILYRAQRAPYESCGRPGKPVVRLKSDFGAVKRALEDFE